MALRIDTKAYIQDKLLDLMETKPFYNIKVTEFVRFAEISRSTFYAHYDSIFDALQEMEDGFIEELGLRGYDLKRAASAKERSDVEPIIHAIEAIGNNLRKFRILTGTNGDPRFTAKLERVFRKQVYDVAGIIGTDGSKKQLDLTAAALGSSSLAAYQWWANHPDEYTKQDILIYSLQFIGGVLEMLKPKGGR